MKLISLAAAGNISTGSEIAGFPTGNQYTVYCGSTL